MCIMQEHIHNGFEIILIIMQMDAGILRACFEAEGDNWCIVQMYEEDTSEDGKGLVNEFDCPILKLTKVLLAAPTTCILSPASIVHNCNLTCTFNRAQCKRRIEQEQVELPTLKLDHNNRLNSFLFNIYCMKCPSMTFE